MVNALAVLPQRAHPKLWAGTLLLCVLLNILWYTAKFVLRANGYPVSFIWHSNDFTNLLRLVLNERDLPQHRWHVALLVSFSVVFLAFIASAVMFFVAPRGP
jgi:hypothetical protein